jgi:hypothetical protein
MSCQAKDKPAGAITGFEKRPTASGSRTPIRIYRTDGSNRVYEGRCTGVACDNLGLRVPAIFSVGEVVELVFLAGDDTIRHPARVIYRTSDHYGLSFLRNVVDDVSFRETFS